MHMTRSKANPIIRPHMDDRMGDNVNGPSLIRVPEWVSEPLGCYYLYFAHHDGRYIRLAYANDLDGPWTIHRPGVLSLEEARFIGHVASPDVHVDHDERRIRMYFHGADQPSAPGRGPQFSRVAVSADGLRFHCSGENLGAPYFRAFAWDGWHYVMAMPGIFYRSRDGLSGFERGPTWPMPNMRHTALAIDGSVMTVYFTLVGECPERIQRGRVDLARDWNAWQLDDVEDVLSPETDYEGVNAPRVPSARGLVEGPAYQLRDPAIFREDGRTWLLYSIAGEAGIAMAELRE